MKIDIRKLIGQLNEKDQHKLMVWLMKQMGVRAEMDFETSENRGALNVRAEHFDTILSVPMRKALIDAFRWCEGSGYESHENVRKYASLLREVASKADKVADYLEDDTKPWPL